MSDAPTSPEPQGTEPEDTRSQGTEPQDAASVRSTGEHLMTWQHGTTWYRVVGELDPAAEQAPVVVLHGGPGVCHDYTEPIAELISASGRAAVLYDQIGCGLSSHLPDAPSAFWTPQLFMHELTQLLEHLGIAGRYALVGQSWGGMLAMQYALDAPAGLSALVVCDSPASMPLWSEEANRLRADLPLDVQQALDRHEAAGTTDDPEYTAAVRVFYDRHVCRVPWPECVERSFAKMEAEPTVYHTMNGPSEFHVIGSLKDWDITYDLPLISAPTLLISGRHDEATPLIMSRIHERIGASRWVVFEESSHMPHIEQPTEFQAVLATFLASTDG